MKKKMVPLLLLSVIGILCASCGNAETAPENTEKQSDITAEIPGSDHPTSSGIPADVNFDGEEFLTAAPHQFDFMYYYFADDETGEIMNDSVYQRRRAVEERLNVSLKYQYFDDAMKLIPELQRDIQSGDGVYDHALIHLIYGVLTLTTGGFLYDIGDLPYVDMNAQWWNQEQMENLRFGKEYYFAVNDFMLPSPYLIFFNRDIVRNKNLEDPYSLVYDGKWTIEKFAEMARSVKDDANGDGKMDFDDFYGVTAEETSKYISFMTGCDQMITKRENDGHIALALNTEKTQKIVELFADLSKNNVCYIPKSSAPEDELTLDTERLLFSLGSLNKMEIMRGYSNVDVGFLPYPKYDEEQESYYSLEWACLQCVPKSIKNPELVGAVIEELAFQSDSTVVPTYFNQLLEGKFSNDEDAANMLHLIFDTIRYEPCGNYFGFSEGFGDLFYFIGRLAVNNQSTDFSSWYAKNEAPALKVIDDFYEALKDVEESDF